MTGEDEALSIAKAAHQKFPEDPRVLERFVLLLVGWNRTRDAEEIIERALSRKVARPEYWLALGKIAQHVWPMPEPELGAPLLINDIYQKALAAGEDDPAISEAVADFYHASGQDHLAEPIYREIIANDPSVIDPYEKLARIHLAEEPQNLEDAADLLAELLKYHPRLPATQRLIATIYEEMANNIYRESEAAVASGQPERARSLIDQFTGRLNDSIRHFEQALRISRGDERDYLYTGNLMVRAGSISGSHRAFPAGPLSLPRFRSHHQVARDVALLR